MSRILLNRMINPINRNAAAFIPSAALPTKKKPPPPTAETKNKTKKVFFSFGKLMAYLRFS